MLAALECTHTASLLPSHTTFQFSSITQQPRPPRQSSLHMRQNRDPPPTTPTSGQLDAADPLTVYRSQDDPGVVVRYDVSVAVFGLVDFQV